MKLDLHMHSNYSSDGQHSVDDLCQFVKESGVNLFSLTDHNTILGVNKIIEQCCPIDSVDLNRVNFITGIELSTYFKETEIHLLVYGIDPNHPVLNQIIEEFKVNRLHQAKLRVEALQSMGMRIDFDELNEAAEGKTASGVTFLNVLKRYPENKLHIKPYIDGDKSDSPYTNFYFDFFFRGGKAFVYVPLLDYIETIHRLKDHGVLVIAHPGLYPVEMIDTLVTYDIDGIEVYSSYHDVDKNEYFVNIAKQNGLLMTSGSDFHGDLIKPGIKIGGVMSAGQNQTDRLLDLMNTKNLKYYALSHI